MDRATKEAAFRASYQTKVCWLSLIGQHPRGAGLVNAQGSPANGGETEAMSCLGPACAAFIKHVDETGAPVGGGCAPALVPGALNLILGTLHGLTQSVAKLVAMVGPAQPGGVGQVTQANTKPQ